jgi:hypothetical protein
VKSEDNLHPVAAKYQDADTEHPDYPFEDWQYELNNGDTQLEYWSWLSHQLESADNDAKYEAKPKPFDPFNL